MQIISSPDAKNGFGRSINFVRAKPEVIKKHRLAVVVIAFEDYERLTTRDADAFALVKVEKPKPKDK